MLRYMDFAWTSHGMYVRPLSFLNVAHQHMNFSSESLTRNDFYVQSTRAHTTQQTLTIRAEKKET